MIRRPPRSTLSSSSAASDVYKRQASTSTSGQIIDWQEFDVGWDDLHDEGTEGAHHARVARFLIDHHVDVVVAEHMGCLLYTSDAADEEDSVDLGGRRIIKKKNK